MRQGPGRHQGHRKWIAGQKGIAETQQKGSAEEENARPKLRGDPAVGCPCACAEAAERKNGDCGNAWRGEEEYGELGRQEQGPSRQRGRKQGEGGRKRSSSRPA